MGSPQVYRYLLLWTTLWTNLIMSQLPDSKYFKLMDYLMTNIVVALREYYMLWACQIFVGTYLDPVSVSGSSADDDHTSTVHDKQKASCATWKQAS